MPSSRRLEDLTRDRAKQTARECGEHYDSIVVRSEVTEHLGLVTVLQDGFIISKEFVETDGSLCRPHRMAEYAQALLDKARLVVAVPQPQAVELWLNMLELNRRWLFYYQLYYYDDDGRLHRLDREAWRRLRGLHPDERRSPEVA